MAQQIPEEDLVAVRSYITDRYPLIDDALRAIDMPMLQEYDAHIRVATFGLYELPVYRGPVFRGTTLPDALVAQYVPGSVIQERAFVAGSANPACRFPGNVLYVIQSFNGRLVRGLADEPEEFEVVFFTQTRFKVLAVDSEAARPEHTIYLAEIPDPRLTPKR
jgi:hypothetical protein